MGHSSEVIDAVWTLDDLRLFSCSKEAIFEWEVGKNGRVRENIAKQCTCVSLALSSDGILIAARIDEDASSIPGLGIMPRSNLCIWDPTSNIEQSPQKVYLQDEVTRVAATTNLTSESTLEAVQNVVIAGTNEVSLCT